MDKWFRFVAIMPAPFKSWLSTFLIENIIPHFH